MFGFKNQETRTLDLVVREISDDPQGYRFEVRVMTWEDLAVEIKIDGQVVMMIQWDELFWVVVNTAQQQERTTLNGLEVVCGGGKQAFV